MAPIAGLLSILVVMGLPAVTTCFSVGRSELAYSRSAVKKTSRFVLFQSSFVADGSEYSSRDSADMDDDMDDSRNSYDRNYRDNQDETPTIELSPVPMSKNAGNRFVAFFWDAQLNEDEKKDGLDLHHDRIALTEKHVMFCRKTNLYNETFNQDSMVDVLWSLPMYVIVPSGPIRMI